MYTHLYCSSLTKLCSPEEQARTLPPRAGTTSSSMGQRGRSWSNLSLSHAPSMSSVIEEPRRSTSTTSKWSSYGMIGTVREGRGREQVLKGSM